MQSILKSACETTKKQKNLWNIDLVDFCMNGKSSVACGSNFLDQHYVEQIEKSLEYEVGSTKEKYCKLQNLLLAVIQSAIYIP